LDEYGAPQPDPAAAQIWHTPVDTAEKVDGLLRAAGFISIRAWQEELVSPIDSEHLLNIWTRLGGWRIRFDSLEIAAREACIENARRRMEVLTPADFVAKGKVVYAVASAS
jgi:hypothetical protein